jgi:hypothetical protein
MDKKQPFEELSAADMSLQEAIGRFTKIRRNEVADNIDIQFSLFEEGYSEISLFQGTEIRKVFHENEWFYSIIDIVTIITGTEQPTRYWNELKHQLENVEKLELFGKTEKLKVVAQDGKLRPTECADAETIFRIIQSIPSPKAEPFKRWFAKVAYERIQEIQNPEIAARRAMMFYKAKGYPDEWISNRIKTIAVRKELTDEWQRRGVEDSKDYAVLTDIINKETFDKHVQEHKIHKCLNKTDDLRDHMTPIELALTMLAETTTKEFAKNMDAHGVPENADAAKKGGEVGKAARVSIERKLGKSVVSKDNYLSDKQKQLRLLTKK